MAQSKSLNELLKWSIENTTTGSPDTSNNNTTNGSTAVTSTSAAASPAAPAAASDTTTTTNGTKQPLDPELLAQLFGGPSEAELMQAAVAHITSTDPEITLESRLTAFDNLEQLVESLDNANLLGKLGLWTPLLGLLGHAEREIRLMAAWCVGTAVQNNAPCQERLVALGGVERLVGMALGERAPAFEPEGAVADDAPAAQEGGAEDKEVRRKAVYALSSAVRNYQPAMDVCTSELRKKGEQVDDKIDATDMDAINGLIDNLKEKAKNA
ncbi:hsp70 nucleotide exchange factor fes1 [Diatrype stigma]|uniref:Hsp70 nucleotide exchange factor fes1 n=1 Tax=Diatrype stigma TaxID=117547 RepID=A0AAN9UJD7_9PEZI